MTGQTARMGSNQPLPRVGAPVLEAFAPLSGTEAARFYDWLMSNEPRIGQMLDRLTQRWRPLGSFIEINFMHPETGPAGALVMTRSTIDVGAMRRRLERLMVIPLRELAEYLPSWERGVTVVVAVEAMPDPLARRYAATPVRWSVNVPIIVDGSWVGVVGAVGGEEGFEAESVAGFEAMAKVLMCEFAADEAWTAFQAAGGGNRLLQLLR